MVNGRAHLNQIPGLQVRSFKLFLESIFGEVFMEECN